MKITAYTIMLFLLSSTFVFAGCQSQQEYHSYTGPKAESHSDVTSSDAKRNEMEVQSSETESYAYGVREFQFILPEDMECVVTTNSSGLILRQNEIVGGFLAVDFRKGLLGNLDTNKREILSTLIDSVNKQIDLSDYDAILSKEIYITVVFKRSDNEYKHYLIFHDEAELYYDLWFDSKQVDEESIMKIVYSSGVVLN